MVTEFESIPALLNARVLQSAKSDALFWLSDDGQWRPLTYQDYWSRVCVLAMLLRELGVRRGDRVAIVMPASTDWEISEKAVLSIGGVVVGVEPHSSDGDLAHIVAATKPIVVVVRAGDCRERLKRLDSQSLTILTAGNGSFATADRDTSLWQAHLDVSCPDEAWIAGFPGSGDVATIIFTSGTTGIPKGIPYTHGQVLLACASLLESYAGIDKTDNTVCWLPLANLFQRMMNLCAIAVGSPVYIVEDPRSLVERLPAIRPSMLIGVPRFYQKLQHGMLSKIEHTNRLVRILIQAALANAIQDVRSKADGKNARLPKGVTRTLVDRFVFSRFRMALGGQIKFMVTGSAPCPIETLEFFHALGLPLLEAYGLSENVVPIATNRLDDCRLGSVGKPLEANRIKIAEDGELLVKGQGLFRGYYGEQARNQIFDAEGYYASGDYARIDRDGYVFLTGRKSDVVKSSTGRKIHLPYVERTLETAASVDRVAVFVDGKVPIAVVTLDSIQPTGPADTRSRGLGEIDSVKIRDELQNAQSHLAQYERVAAVLVLGHAFSVARGELTPNLKLRRAAIGRRYREQIASLYRRIDANTQRGDDDNGLLVEFTSA